MTTRRRVVSAVTAWFAAIGTQQASAHSLTYDSASEPPALVTMIDGKDRNESVSLRYDVVDWNGKHEKRGKHGKHESRYLFGYFEGGEFRALTGRKGTAQFAGGSMVDFALAGKGMDGIFGTGDDAYYRLSDAEDYADLYFRKPVWNGKSRAPAVEDDYFGKLMIAWDTDLDGKTDFRVHLRARSHYDGMAVTAVPLPAAGLLLASGLVGLAMWRRRSEREH